MYSIVRIGEIFLNLLNNNGLFQITTQKISEIKKKLKIKEKEIEASKILLGKLIENKERVKYINNKEIEDVISTTKLNYKEYKDKIEILLIYKEIINNSHNKEEIKNIMNNYNKIYERCEDIFEKIMSDITIIYLHIHQG